MTPALSFTGAVWRLQSADPARVATLRARGLSEATARCLALRELPEPERLTPALASLHDPFAMLGMDAAVDQLRRAGRDRQRVRIITDYDVDGTTSSLILQAALRRAQPDVAIDYHIPDRFRDGYGFSVAAAEKAVADGVDVIVTADIGVRDHASVAAARDGGVGVLICDHHLPAGATVPDGATVLCPPQHGCTYPNRALAACGVSTKLAQALLAKDPALPRLLPSLLKLAAIGTVADMVNLATPENRAIVGLGVDALNAGGHSPGLAALLQAADLRPGEIRAADLAFRVGPRINAAGRIANATHVIELLTCRDEARAGELAQALERLNRTRRAVQAQLVEQVLAAVPTEPDPFVLVAGPEEDGWHRGVVGIVAARLKDELHRPVAVVSIQGPVAVGSVRSVPGVHAVRALESAGDLLVRFGGHPAAAGFTVPVEHLDTLRRRLNDWVLAHAEDAVGTAEREIDAVVQPADLQVGLYDELARLGPFGMGNPEPRLLLQAPRPQGLRRIGKEGKHLKWSVPRPDGGVVDAIWWSGADHHDALLQGPLELLGSLAPSRHAASPPLQFIVADARHAPR